MALTDKKADTLAARVADLGHAPDGWLAQAQQRAATRLAAMGLPGPRDEYWRYTNPGLLNAPTPAHVLAMDDADQDVFDGIARLRVVFTNGRFDAEASDTLSEAGVEMAPLSSAGKADIHWARDHYARLETAGQEAVARPHAVLNSAYATDGVVLRATADVARPIQIIYRGAATADAILHHVIRVEPGARLTVLETGQGGARLSTAIEADVGAGGVLHHVRAQPRTGGFVANAHLFAKLGANSILKSFTLSGAGQLVRNESVIDLQGDDGVAHIAGVLVGGDGAHHDDTVFMIHAAERCESRQVYKRVLRDATTGVFQGKILVRAGAQKTDGYQISQGLLLDAASQSLAKPELEIYADDVKCSHGSTTGAIDETALFYLRSRGVPQARAEALLVLAFLAEAVTEIEDEAVAAAILAQLKTWLGSDID